MEDERQLKVLFDSLSIISIYKELKFFSRNKVISWMNQKSFETCFASSSIWFSKSDYISGSRLVSNFVRSLSIALFYYFNISYFYLVGFRESSSANYWFYSIFWYLLRCCWYIRSSRYGSSLSAGSDLVFLYWTFLIPFYSWMGLFLVGFVNSDDSFWWLSGYIIFDSLYSNNKEIRGKQFSWLILLRFLSLFFLISGLRQ